MKNDGFVRQFCFISWMGAFLFFSPFILLAWCNHPSADDYPLSVTARDWGSYTTVVGYWKCWSARYTSIFLMSVNPLVFGSLWAYKGSFFILLALSSGSYFMALKMVFPSYAVSNRAALAACCTLIQAAGMPSVSNGFYYLGGALFYIPGHFFFTTALLLAFSQIRYPRQDGWAYFQLAFLTGLWVLLVGCNEIMLLLALSLSMLFTFLAFFYRHPMRLFWGVSHVLVWAAVALVLLSPASFYRMEASGGLNRPWFWVVQSGVEACFRQMFQGLSQPGLLFMLLLLKMLPNSHSPFFAFSLSQKASISVFSILLFAICFFPSFLGEGFIQPRSGNTLYFLFFILCVSQAGLWLPPLQLKPVWRWVLAGLILAFSLGSLNFRQALTDLLSGDAFTYNRERFDRIRQVEASRSDSVWVKPVSVKPVSIFAGEIGDYPDPWYDNFYAQYHGKKFIHLLDSTRRP